MKTKQPAGWRAVLLSQKEGLNDPIGNNRSSESRMINATAQKVCREHGVDAGKLTAEIQQKISTIQ